MSRVVIDTNVLVSFLTDRNVEQQAQAAALFEAAARGEIEIILHQMVISEMVYVLTNLYGLEAAEIARLLEDLLATAGVTPVDEVVWRRVLEHWPNRFADFADAILAAVCSTKRYDAVATFDRKLRRKLRKLELGTFWDADQPQGSHGL